MSRVSLGSVSTRRDDLLGTLGTSGMGLNLDAAQRQMDCVKFWQSALGLCNELGSSQSLHFLGQGAQQSHQLHRGAREVFGCDIGPSLEPVFLH